MSNVSVITQTMDRKSIDDYLGGGETRFFGSGYRRAAQRLRNLRLVVGEDGSGTVMARAAVEYPRDWSMKGKAERPPHLSSIDVLLLAGETAEVYLTHVYHLDDAQRSRMRLSRVVIKAGRSPVEEALGGFGVEATVAPLGAVPGRPDLWRSVADCLVGTLRVRCEIEHPVTEASERRPPGTASYTDPDELLGPATRRPFAAAHREKSQLIGPPEVDMERLRASAACTVVRPNSPVVGLESDSYQSMSVIDVFVVAIQLGQVLLYELDQIGRESTNTLWMRQTVLEIGEPGGEDGPGQVAPAMVRAGLDQPELLVAADGETWRTAAITGSCGEIRLRCAVAHQLPSQTSPRLDGFDDGAERGKRR